MFKLFYHNATTCWRQLADSLKRYLFTSWVWLKFRAFVCLSQRSLSCCEKLFDAIILLHLLHHIVLQSYYCHQKCQIPLMLLGVLVLHRLLFENYYINLLAYTNVFFNTDSANLHRLRAGKYYKNLLQHTIVFFNTNYTNLHRLSIDGLKQKSLQHPVVLSYKPFYG